MRKKRGRNSPRDGAYVKRQQITMKIHPRLLAELDAVCERYDISRGYMLEILIKRFANAGGQLFPPGDTESVKLL